MISTKGRYAIRLMIDLAEQPQDTAVPLNDIAKRQGISKKYLESVVKLLVQGKLVKGASGKGGGYRLTRAPEAYTIDKILTLTEGTLASVACLEHVADPCPNASYCKTLPMWQKYDALTHDFFAGITLSDLVAGNV